MVATCLLIGPESDTTVTNEQAPRSNTCDALPTGTPNWKIELSCEILLWLLAISVSEIGTVNVTIMKAKTLFRETDGPEWDKCQLLRSFWPFGCLLGIKVETRLCQNEGVGIG
jgi:hypothetical protein